MSYKPDSRANLDAEATTSATAGNFVEKWNYQVFIIQGIVANASKRIGSARLLLPYLYVATGSPLFLAGALMPIVSIARRIGQFIAAPIVSTSQTRTWFLFFGWMATALSLVAAGLSARIPQHWIVMAIFVLAALAMGLAKGLSCSLRRSRLFPGLRVLFLNQRLFGLSRHRLSESLRVRCH